MSPRSIGSQRYTNLLTKMRSWSSSEGIMLVPSTFTGWYRKMMMKAEIASEMMRSRTQTTNPAMRTGFATGDSAAMAATDRAPAGGPSVLGSSSFSIILLHCIQKSDSRQQVVSILRHRPQDDHGVPDEA